jgi:hypothetical protein
MNFLLFSAYFGPVQYFSKLASNSEILLERFENYPKQTYRNRCIIYAANGPLTLTIPVTKDDIKVYTKDIKIDYSTNWQKIHLKALESAYRNSPFYTYYVDELAEIILSNEEFLFDLNLKLTQALCENIGIVPVLSVTSEYQKTPPAGYADFREAIHPKAREHKPDHNFEPPCYSQVFEPKYGFYENLSILDLLFNVGPDCKILLINSLKNS